MLPQSTLGGLLMSPSTLTETPGGFGYSGTDCVGWMPSHQAPCVSL
jgi:hypothetical protein